MFPSQTISGREDTKLGYAKFICQFLCGKRAAANEQNISLRKFCRMVFFAPRFWMGYMSIPSSFADSIESIVLLSPSFQVLRVATRGIVARMKNQLTFWDWPFGEHIGKSMCRSGMHSGDAEVSVTILPLSTSPEPAFFTLATNNFPPKSLFNWLCASWHVSSMHLACPGVK